MKMMTNLGKFLINNSRILVANNIKLHQRRWEGGDNFLKSNIGSSTILVQDGTFVSEVPVIFRKVDDVLNPIPKKVSGNEHHKSFSNSDVFNLIHKEFLKCANLQEVITLLTKCSRITPNIAAGAVERLLVLKEQVFNKKHKEIDEDVLENVLSNLVITVKKSENAYTIINCMKTVPIHLVDYRNALCDALLEKIMDKNLSVLQLCDVVEAFSQNAKYHKHLENTDKLWFGFLEMEQSIDKKEIVRCFQIVHLLKSSRRMVINVLERRIDKVWCQLNSDDMLNILMALHKHNLTSPHTLTCLGRWLATSIHLLNDKALLDILDKLAEVNYTDSNIQKSIERFVKSKGISIELNILIVAILNHCMMFRLRNTQILNGCAEFIIAHAKELDPIYIRPIFYPFAWLNYTPPNGSRFWEEFENAFNENFHTMNKEDILDVMMGCVYLQKYPLNFINLVYNPSFLDKINVSPKKDVLRNKMKLLDTAMTIECKSYSGPLLPKDHSAKSLWQDGRISRIINQLGDDLDVIAGGSGCYSSNVILPNVFATELYLVDIMLHPRGLKSSILNFNLKIDRDINTALLIMLPEHYCFHDETLIGPQAMRVRHLKMLGLKVSTLKYEVLSRLRMHKKDLHAYLVERLKNAESSM